MSVVLSVAEAGVCRKQLTIEVPADEVATETRKVLAAYGKQVDIPGFRKGKVPPQVLRQRFGDEIDREVVDRLLPRFWHQAEHEQQLEPLGEPELVEVGDVAAGQPLRFVAAVDVRPAVELGDLDGFELPEIEVEPSDEDLATALDDLRRQVGEWRPVERTAARGDRVRARLFEERGTVGGGTSPADDDEKDAAEGADDGAETGEASAGGEAAAEEGEVVHLEVGDPRVWEELSLAATGLAAGQEGRFTRRPPEAGEAAPRSFRLVVEEVAERELPPLDDELAARLGDFENLEALRDAVAGRLRRDRRLEGDGRRREALLEQLRGRCPLALPEGVVRAEVQSLIESYAQDLSHRGVDPNAAGLDWSRVAAEARPSAERRVHDRLLLDAVAERQAVEVPADEVEATMAAIGRAAGESAAQVRRKMGPQGIDGLRREMRRERALRSLLGVDVPTAADAGAAPEDGAEE